MEQRSKILVQGLIIFSVLLLAYSPIRAEEPYKIGIVTSLSGSIAFLGYPVKNAAQLLVEEINHAGGVGGHPIELIVYDDEMDPTKGVSAFKKLIYEDKVLAVLGASHSAVSVAAFPFIEEAKIPNITFSTVLSASQPLKKWIFQSIPTVDVIMEKNLRFLKKRGINKAALIYSPDTLGLEGKEWVEKLAPKIGVDIVRHESVGAKDTDATTQLTRIKASEAKGIILTIPTTTNIVVIKNYRMLGMDQVLITGSGFASERYLKLTGPDANGVFCPGYKIPLGDQLPDIDPSKKLIMRVSKKYEERYKEPFNIFGGEGWDHPWITIEAIRKAGPDRSKIRDAIEQTRDFVGTIGTHNFSSTNHSGIGPDALYIMKVVDEKFKLGE